ncbi:MAG: DNA-processing protein DprA, partial [Christensenellales bacterium]
AVPGNAFIEAAVGKDTARALFSGRDEAAIDKRIKQLKAKGIRVVTRLNPEYPRLLHQSDCPPPLLYVMGKLPKGDKYFAIVGTRNCSRYGEGVARMFSSGLSQSGVTVVSGMARGIDTAANAAAAESGGSTVAVLGCGVDIVYPGENRRLYDRIIECGAVVSEFAPGTRPLPGNFPIRNRVISGMCRGVLIVESQQRSGAHITASHALEQGRDVFAVPGNINSKYSTGPNMLIREGARVALTPDDILSEYGWRKGAVRAVSKVKKLALEGDESRAAELLMKGDMDVDSLAAALDIDINKVNSMLTMMEIRGIIKKLPANIYTLYHDI